MRDSTLFNDNLLILLLEKSSSICYKKDRSNFPNYKLELDHNHDINIPGYVYLFSLTLCPPISTRDIDSQ
ncbi:hypothetical protein L2E82_15605 [Cichorium intybus]|uniref:Uncharacterized protein n=1 Tax=Cichorium intybus TaxID=13427 RepID=A0ACB9F4I8_CICIN|nr:hypothetical protein L2E82_15605 [Cichorium intybus]